MRNKRELNKITDSIIEQIEEKLEQSNGECLFNIEKINFILDNTIDKNLNLSESISHSLYVYELLIKKLKQKNYKVYEERLYPSNEGYMKNISMEEIAILK